MSGGASEYVMGVMENAENSTTPVSGRNNDYNSGFTGTLTYPNDGSNPNITSIENVSFPGRGYYDVYNYGSSYNKTEAYKRGQLGDATRELRSFSNNKSDKDGSTRYHSTWNKDYAYFVYTGYPWFTRGGACYYGTSAGLFAYDDAMGRAAGDVSFRTVLVK